MTKGKKMGQHGVRQDKDYVSRITQADFDAFKAMPDGTHEKYLASVKFRVGTDGKQVKIVQDMPLAFARYGFADKNAANQWINGSEDW